MFVTVTSVAIRLVVLRDGDAEAEAEAEADEPEPFEVPDVLEHDATAKAMTGTVLIATMRATLEVTERPYPQETRKT